MVAVAQLGRLALHQALLLGLLNATMAMIAVPASADVRTEAGQAVVGVVGDPAAIAPLRTMLCFIDRPLTACPNP